MCFTLIATSTLRYLVEQAAQKNIFCLSLSLLLPVDDQIAALAALLRLRACKWLRATHFYVTVSRARETDS